MIYAFGPFELDDERFELRKRGVRVQMQPRSFDLLAFLVRRGDRVSTRAELIAGVWSGTLVSKDAIAHAVMTVRAALDNDDRAPFVETVRGRGYRFAAPVAMVSPSAPHARTAPCARCGWHA